MLIVGVVAICVVLFVLAFLVSRRRASRSTPLTAASREGLARPAMRRLAAEAVPKFSDSRRQERRSGEEGPSQDELSADAYLFGLRTR